MNKIILFALLSFYLLSSVTAQDAPKIFFGEGYDHEIEVKNDEIVVVKISDKQFFIRADDENGVYYNEEITTSALASDIGLLTKQCTSEKSICNTLNIEFVTNFKGKTVGEMDYALHLKDSFVVVYNSSSGLKIFYQNEGSVKVLQTLSKVPEILNADEKQKEFSFLQVGFIFYLLFPNNPSGYEYTCNLQKHNGEKQVFETAELLTYAIQDTSSGYIPFFCGKDGKIVRFWSDKFLKDTIFQNEGSILLGIGSYADITFRNFEMESSDKKIVHFIYKKENLYMNVENCIDEKSSVYKMSEKNILISHNLSFKVYFQPEHGVFQAYIISEKSEIPIANCFKKNTLTHYVPAANNILTSLSSSELVIVNLANNDISTSTI